jgi:hypothetical protein
MIQLLGRAVLATALGSFVNAFAQNAETTLLKVQKQKALLAEIKQGFKSGETIGKKYYQLSFGKSCGFLFATKKDSAAILKSVATATQSQSAHSAFEISYHSGWVKGYVQEARSVWKPCEAQLSELQRNAVSERLEQCRNISRESLVSVTAPADILNLPSANIPKNLKSFLLTPYLSSQGKTAWEMLLNQGDEWANELPCILVATEEVYRYLEQFN